MGNKEIKNFIAYFLIEIMIFNIMMPLGLDTNLYAVEPNYLNIWAPTIDMSAWNRSPDMNILYIPNVGGKTWAHVSMDIKGITDFTQDVIIKFNPKIHEQFVRANRDFEITMPVGRAELFRTSIGKTDDGYTIDRTFSLGKQGSAFFENNTIQRMVRDGNTYIAAPGLNIGMGAPLSSKDFVAGLKRVKVLMLIGYLIKELIKVPLLIIKVMGKQLHSVLLEQVVH